MVLSTGRELVARVGNDLGGVEVGENAHQTTSEGGEGRRRGRRRRKREGWGGEGEEGRTGKKREMAGAVTDTLH